MARPLDPYRALELPRDATLEDVKAAYRRLAKLYHPDSAGDRALPRFLAIQAAYEALTEGPGRVRPALGGRRRPAGTGWATSPSAGGGGGSAGGRASARQERAGTEPGMGRTNGPGRTGGGPRRAGRTAGPSDAPGPGGGAGAAGRAGGSGAAGSRPRGTAGSRPRRVRRAPGSTSYDGAESEPFEPEWEGASWYGGSSGTYWTLNPREFADPRKHGPEYARRTGARAGRGRTASPPGAAAADAAHDEAAFGPTMHAPPDGASGEPAWAEGAAGLPRAETRTAWPEPGPSTGPSGRAADPSLIGVIGAALIALVVVAGLLAILGASWARGVATALLVVAVAATIALLVVRRVGRA